MNAHQLRERVQRVTTHPLRARALNQGCGAARRSEANRRHGRDDAQPCRAGAWVACGTARHATPCGPRARRSLVAALSDASPDASPRSTERGRCYGPSSSTEPTSHSGTCWPLPAWVLPDAHDSIYCWKFPDRRDLIVRLTTRCRSLVTPPQDQGGSVHSVSAQIRIPLSPGTAPGTARTVHCRKLHGNFAAGISSTPATPVADSHQPRQLECLVQLRRQCLFRRLCWGSQDGLGHFYRHAHWSCQCTTSCEEKSFDPRCFHGQELLRCV